LSATAHAIERGARCAGLSGTRWLPGLPAPAPGRQWAHIGGAGQRRHRDHGVPFGKRWLVRADLNGRRCPRGPRRSQEV